MEQQTTLRQPFTLSGPGLHMGGFITVRLFPAEADTGIVFRRTDVSKDGVIPAVADYVAGTNHGTTVSRDGVSVSTIEHLMSALHGLRVDNVEVEIDGPEVPILDGSARYWVSNIQQAGIATLDAPRRYYTLRESVRWTDDETGIELCADPSDHFEVVSTIIFNSELIGSQTARISDFGQYVPEISNCRTFVFLHEIEQLLAANLIKGGALSNALVFVDKPLSDASRQHLAQHYNCNPADIAVHNGVLNTVQPYFPNEPARHKLLDFIGDIYLVGAHVNARFTLRCPGHRANAALAKLVRQKYLSEK